MDKQSLVTMIVDILRNKQETAAQGPGMAPPTPQPGMLGQGGAAQAGQQVNGREQQIMNYVNQAGR
jgi:hypothetical protein